MDWEAEGLLEGVEGGEREARRALLDSLHAEGVGVDELRRAVAEDRLALVRIERMLLGEPCYTMRELAEKAGSTIEFQQRYRRTIGLAVPDPDERAFSEADLEDARRAAHFFDAGISEADILDSERVLGEGLARYAETFRMLFGQAFIRPGDSEADVADRYAAAAEALRPLAAPHLAHLFFLHLHERIRSDVLSAEERRTGHLRGRERTAIAFADLVGFTRLGETVTEEELGGVAAQLTEVVGATVRPPVRLVKTIGDAVMLVAPEPAPLVAAALALVDAAEGAGLPPLRAGVAYGPALNRWGDWYGSTVNLASRLTERARAGTVLAEDCVREEAAEGFDWSFAGEKKLKGFSAPAKAWRARPAVA